MNEFDIIEKYFAGLFTGGNGEVVLAAGDDCAILDVPDGKELCVSTDTFIEGVHFLEGAPGDVVAQRALAASTSDLAAMGASPLCCVLALTMPEADHGWLEVFSGSLGKLTDEWMIPLVGGNLARGTELSLTFTVMGIVPAGRALRRSGAAVGDDVYVSGVPGEAGAGLALLQADSKAGGPMVGRHLYPEPRLALGLALVDVASAAIDVSDGLVADLTHLAKASGVDAVIRVEDLPVSRSLIEAVGEDQARTLILSSGENYELCFTAPIDSRQRISELAVSHDIAITRIGTVEAGAGEVIVLDESGVRLVPSPGWMHF